MIRPEFTTFKKEGKMPLIKAHIYNLCKSNPYLTTREIRNSCNEVFGRKEDKKINIQGAVIAQMRDAALNKPIKNFPTLKKGADALIPFFESLKREMFKILKQLGITSTHQQHQVLDVVFGAVKYEEKSFCLGTNEIALEIINQENKTSQFKEYYKENEKRGLNGN